jgi:outer membrane receptor protein involved in Fe transport
VQTAATDHYAFDTQGNDFVKLDYGVTKLTSFITSRISNELLFQYGRELNDEGQQPFSAYTKQYLFGTNGATATASGGFTPNVPEVNVAATTSGFYIGSPYYSYRKALPDERKWQIGDILYYNKGNHSFKFGTDNVHNADTLNNTYESNGYISYTYLGNYINDVLNENKANSTCNSSASAAPSSATAVATGTYPCYTSIAQGFGPPAFSIATMDYGFFGQDNWKVTPRLSLELGLRWDYEALPPPFANLVTLPRSDQHSQRQDQLRAPHRVLLRSARQRQHGAAWRLRHLLWPHHQRRPAQCAPQYRQSQWTVHNHLQARCPGRNSGRPAVPEYRCRRGRRGHP